jgi:hypothetical protein
MMLVEKWWARRKCAFAHPTLATLALDIRGEVGQFVDGDVAVTRDAPTAAQHLKSQRRLSDGRQTDRWRCPMTSLSNIPMHLGTFCLPGPPAVICLSEN